MSYMRFMNLQKIDSFNKLIKGLWGFIKRWLRCGACQFPETTGGSLSFFFFKLVLVGLDDFFQFSLCSVLAENGTF